VDDGAVVGSGGVAAEVHRVSLKEPGAGKHSSGQIERYQIVGLSSTASSSSHCRRTRNDAGVYGCSIIGGRRADGRRWCVGEKVAVERADHEGLGRPLTDQNLETREVLSIR
jgi:hypothetical protein